jgi:hypothetical protein
MRELLTKFHEMCEFSVDFFRLHRTKCHYFGNTSRKSTYEKRQNNYKQMKMRKKIVDKNKLTKPYLFFSKLRKMTMKFFFLILPLSVNKMHLLRISNI